MPILCCCPHRWKSSSFHVRQSSALAIFIFRTSSINFASSSSSSSSSTLSLLHRFCFFFINFPSASTLIDSIHYQVYFILFNIIIKCIEHQSTLYSSRPPHQDLLNKASSSKLLVKTTLPVDRSTSSDISGLSSPPFRSQQD